MKRRIMINGEMQSGKTTYVVNRYLSRQKENEVEVFINYNTNASMESTNEKIRKHDINLYTGLEQLKRFHSRITRRAIEGKYVLSLIAHHSSLEELKQIISSYHTKYGRGILFNVNIDEDDSLALDHSTKKGFVQKQRITQAIIELPAVGEVRNITATPFANHFSETDFDDVILAPRGDTYVGIKEIIDSAKDTLEDNDVESLFGETLTSSALNYITEEYEGVKLIQIAPNKSSHVKIVKNLRKYSKNSVIGVSNSDESSYTYYVNGEGVDNKSSKFTPTRVYELAEKHNIKKVFIVAFYLSDRTNTFRAPKGRFNKLQSLFYCSRTTNIETILQRAGRLCGYPVQHIPTLITTCRVLEDMMEALTSYESISELQKNNDVRKASERERLLFSLKKRINPAKIKHTNGYKERRRNTYSITTNPINHITEKDKGIIPEHIDMSNTNFAENTELADYLKNKHNTKTILNVTRDTEKRMQLLRPNQNINQSHRALAIKFGKNREYTFIRQILPSYPTEYDFALHNMDDTYWQWSPQPGLSKRRVS